MKNFFFSIIAIIAFSFTANATTGAELVSNYVSQYKDLAIEEQLRTGIPASIKLSMGLLESSFGQSRLATEANNHFGIKWWNANDGAAFVEAMDDDKDKAGNPTPSKFVKFSSAEESYRKHSEFLMTRARYRVLFNYDRTDYRAWAEGLKSCGYATAPDYAEKLIRIIEKYNLAQFDVPSGLSFDKSPAQAVKVAEADVALTASTEVAMSQPVRRTVSAKSPTSAPAANTNVSPKPRTIESSHVENGQKMTFTLTEVQ
ncbi:MAG: glucosaminidase domain-containing protein [Saprospiraceae bacterium]|nr:glucosaminidase domain-containing protein [Saprospiraceae bacterium]